MEWWGWVIAAAGGISTLITCYKLIREAFHPVMQLSERVSTMERHEKNDLKRFEQQENMNVALIKSLVAIMDHLIDGNSIDNLKKASKELTDFIIKH